MKGHAGSGPHRVAVGQARAARLRALEVSLALAGFLSCGRLQGGFARIRCTQCRKEHLLAFSCRTRNFCSSCQAKRSVLFAEKLAAAILAPVPHRHWTFPIPRALRGLFERKRSLLSLLSQTAYASILKCFQPRVGRAFCGLPLGMRSIERPTPKGLCFESRDKLSRPIAGHNPFGIDFCTAANPG